MIRKVLCITSLLAIALTACSSDDGGGDDGGDTTSGVLTVEVLLTDAGCEPADITTPLGPTTFHVTNTDAGAVTEFEVLDGDRILGRSRTSRPGSTATSRWISSPAPSKRTARAAAPSEARSP